ncbi:unnamed protein product [Spirodela intermedia]|uniref:Uncharacterized protein n=1 Tax=Spirodela intermedia TaxID=51605 RepID=A0A7I8LG85_SPIIN|nr:unnamed protein product [Spirodela intermedia]
MEAESPRSEGSSSSAPAAPSVPPVRKLNGGRGRRAAGPPRKAPTMPTPEELVALYESQGMEPREASLRVIKDLQAVLYRTMASGRGKRDRFTADTGRKLDNVGARLAIVEMKLDSKPGYPHLLALGVAAGAVLQGVGSAAPHVLGAFGKMWRAVLSAGR